jgi:hypothetical protein
MIDSALVEVRAMVDDLMPQAIELFPDTPLDVLRVEITVIVMRRLREDVRSDRRH